jgi:hypothetical protein
MHIDVYPIDFNRCKLQIEQGYFPVNKSEHWDWVHDAVEEGWNQAFKALKKYLKSN